VTKVREHQQFNRRNTNTTVTNK